MKRALFVAILLLGPASVAFADHPNEGNVSLSNLIGQALKANLEIKEAEAQSLAARESGHQSISPFLPQVSLEGGYQSSRIETLASEGSFAYGAARMNIYRGGKDQVLMRARSEESQFQQHRVAKIKARIERAVSGLYYELLYLQEGIALKEEALVANKVQRDLAEKKRAAGFTSQADVLEFELREATLNSDINFLRRQEAQKEKDLQRLLGSGSGDEIRVRGHLHRESFTRKLDELLKIGLQEREDLKEAEKAASLSHLEYRSIIGDYLPKVDLEAKYGKLIAEEQVHDRKDNYVMAVKLSLPLFSGLDTHFARQARAHDVTQSELKASRVRQEIRVQLENALAKLVSIGQRLDLEEKNIDRSKQYYTLTLAEYKKGVKNSPDVAGAAERLFDSRLRNLEYRKDYYLTCLEIAEAAGITGQDLLKTSTE